MKTTYFSSVLLVITALVVFTGGVNAFACCKNTCNPPVPSCKPCILHYDDCGDAGVCDTANGCHFEAQSMGLATEGLVKRQDVCCNLGHGCAWVTVDDCNSSGQYCVATDCDIATLGNVVEKDITKAEDEVTA